MEPDVLMSIIYQSMIGIVGIPGNCLIIFVYPRRRLTMSPHVFIFGLAIADLGSCLFIPAIIFQRVASYDSNFICRSLTFVNHATVYLSAFLSTAIIVDRYLAICRPLLRWMTVRRAQIVVVCCVVTSVIVSIPVFVSYKVIFHTLDSKPQCTLDKNSSLSQALMMVLLYSLSIATILVSVVMFWKMWREFRNRPAIFPVDAAPASHEQAMSSPITGDFPEQRCQQIKSIPTLAFRVASKTNIMLFAATAVYFVTWVISLCALSIPRSTVNTVKINSVAGFVIIKVLSLAFYINHAINPFIYGLINKRFREKCKDYLPYCKI